MVKTSFLSRLREACDLVGAELEVIPGADNSGRITLRSGRVRYFHRLHWDLNTLGAAAIARDKDATAHVLKRCGYTVPTGRSFWYVGQLRETRDIGGADAAAGGRCPSRQAPGPPSPDARNGPRFRSARRAPATRQSRRGW